MSSASVSFAEFEQQCRHSPPRLALVLGSGMGPVAGRLHGRCSVSFCDIPGLTEAGVVGHRGCLSLGDWMGLSVLIFEGRLHFYEGHPWERVVLPLQTAARLGANLAVLTNASGGIADHFQPGCLMGLSDHLDCTRPCWWNYPGPAGLVGSRPSPYSVRLQTLLSQAAAEAGIPLAWGVYAALLGPCYETPAEIRALKSWGADAVGMSTAREVEAAVAAGMECAAVSCITNKAAGLSDQPLTHEEVLTTARSQAERLATLLEGFLVRLRASDLTS
jgi:purine-nucleoside phosphorylase